MPKVRQRRGTDIAARTSNNAGVFSASHILIMESMGTLSTYEVLGIPHPAFRTFESWYPV